MNSPELAQKIIAALCANGVTPEVTVTAPPGREWGEVGAWRVDLDGNYAVAYGDCGTTSYGLVTGTDNLDLLLLDPAADAVAVANLRDEPPSTVDDDHCGPCRVVRRRCFFDSRRTYSWVSADTEAPKPVEFGSRIEAVIWILKAESSPCWLDHSEVGRPSFYIVAP